MLLEQYGDVKIALKDNFLAYERSRNDKFVIVSFSYQYFGDAKTSRAQYTIPIEIWEDIDYFVTVKDYVTKRNIAGILKSMSESDYNFSGIFYSLTTNTFKYRAFIEDLSTPSEVKARKEPPFEFSLRECNQDFDDYFDDVEDLYVESDRFCTDLN